MGIPQLLPLLLISRVHPTGSLQYILLHLSRLITNNMIQLRNNMSWLQPDPSDTDDKSFITVSTWSLRIDSTRSLHVMEAIRC
jgi:hypothetical protein